MTSAAKPMCSTGSALAGSRRATWLYDTLAKGQLTSSTRNVNTTDAYTVAVTGYNDAYQPTGTKVTIPPVTGQPAGTYQVDTSYNVNGSIASMGYPAAGGLPAETVSFGYDTTGRPLTARRRRVLHLRHHLLRLRTRVPATARRRQHAGTANGWHR